MSAPKLAIPTKKGRFYTDPQDSKARYISVTNVLDTAINKPALVGWAAKLVAEEAIANLPKWGRLTRLDVNAAIKELKGTPFAARDKAATRGSHIHDIAEKITLEVDPGEIEEEAKAYVVQYLAWREDFRPVFHASEATVVNRKLGYAGTLDAIVEIDGEMLLLDYKTGKGVYPEVALQLVAYENAEALWLPNGSEVPMPKVAGAAVLHISADSYTFMRVATGPATFDAFRSALTVAGWIHASKDTSPLSERLIPSRVMDGPVLAVA